MTDRIKINGIEKNIVARRVILSGIVQGVGFRPFVWRLARSLDLKGRVINTGEEVEIILEGEQKLINRFLEELKKKKPKPAEIYSLSLKNEKYRGYKTFKISESKDKSTTLSMVPPDFAICEECIKEIEDPSSRRYRYPFNSCAECGPRFSAINKVPYDRENTSMKDYPLCEKCKKEYRNRKNLRRGHIQGISCKNCGPEVRLTDSIGEPLKQQSPIVKAAELIEKGKIIGIKGMGGFHIASLATDDSVVKKLRRKKQRPQKPFALMALDLKTAKKFAEIREKAREILLSSKHPILLLPKRKNTALSKFIAPELRKIGIMLPYTGLHYLLLKNIEDRILIMTSGNPRDEPICKTNPCAFSKLSEKVDYFLVHDRKIFNRTDDSVARFTDGEFTLLRRSRGFAPTWFNLPTELEIPLIAFGADLKNTGAVAVKNKAIPTQYIGNMNNIETLGFFKDAMNFLLNTYGIHPSEATLIADQHPEYQSRRLAEKWKERFNTKIEYVQHHRAHITSAMIDNEIPKGKKVIGIGIDGVGYGRDHNVWGGEVLLMNYKEWERVGHLQYHPMIGGDRATNYPVRMLIGVLKSFMDNSEIREILKEQELIKGLEHGEKELNTVLKQSETSQLYTSSLGRILDSISALLGICHTRNYEGGAAMKLESIASKGTLLRGFKLPIKKKEGDMVIDSASLFEKMLATPNVKTSSLALTSQIELGNAFGRIAKKIARKNGINKVIVSGGCAVNTYIIRGIKEAVPNLEVSLPNRIPPGDGEVSLGQIGATMRKYGGEEKAAL